MKILKIFNVFVFCLLGLFTRLYSESPSIHNLNVIAAPNVAKKYILTGVSDAGKTSILEVLKREYNQYIVPEAMGHALSLSKLGEEDKKAFLQDGYEDLVAEVQAQLEAKYVGEANDFQAERVFLDRSILDVLVGYQIKASIMRINGVDFDPPLYSLKAELEKLLSDNSQSKTVFLIERPNVKGTNVRRDMSIDEIELLLHEHGTDGEWLDKESPLLIEKQYEDLYEKAGFTIRRIPYLSIKDRAQMIMDIIQTENFDLE